jgi:hypothetical protein
MPWFEVPLICPKCGKQPELDAVSVDGNAGVKIEGHCEKCGLPLYREVSWEQQGILLLARTHQLNGTFFEGSRLIQ